MPWMQIVTWNDFPEGTAIEPRRDAHAGNAQAGNAQAGSGDLLVGTSLYESTRALARQWHSQPLEQVATCASPLSPCLRLPSPRLASPPSPPSPLLASPRLSLLHLQVGDEPTRLAVEAAAAIFTSRLHGGNTVSAESLLLTGSFGAAKTLAQGYSSASSSSTTTTRPYHLWWSVDNSAALVTPPSVLRGDRGLPLTNYNEGNNGNVTNVYGNKGNMPKYHAGEPQNGGIPQNGSLEVHLDRYRISLNALIPEEDYTGICMLDFEHWRADWNSSDWNERERAVAFAGNGNVTLARSQYEEATKRFMLATINETRFMRPGCLIGWYGYPRNPLPFVGTTSRKNWCGWHSDGASEQCGSWAPDHPGCLIGDACFFENNIDASTRWMRLDTGGGYHTAHAPYQRAINDELAWLFEASDVIIPSIYLGFQSDR